MIIKILTLPRQFSGKYNCYHIKTVYLVTQARRHGEINTKVAHHYIHNILYNHKQYIVHSKVESSIPIAGSDCPKKSIS